MSLKAKKTQYQDIEKHQLQQRSPSDKTEKTIFCYSCLPPKVCAFLCKCCPKKRKETSVNEKRLLFE